MPEKYDPPAERTPTFLSPGLSGRKSAGDP